MKKSAHKSKLSINTPNPQKFSLMDSNTDQIFYQLNRQNQRYNVKTTSNKQDSISSPITGGQKISISQTPNHTSKNGISRPKQGPNFVFEHVSKENVNPNIVHREKIRSDKLFMIKLQPPEQKVATPTKIFEKVDNRKPSPGHVKSNSISKAITQSGVKNTPSHKHSASSTENLIKGNFLGGSSLINSRSFGTNSKDLIMSDSSDRGIHKSILAADERCANHPHKRAKYIVSLDNDEAEPTNKYCSKCAIKLAGNGVKVQEIILSDEAMRKSEIEEFLIKLQNSRREINNFVSSLSKKKEDLLFFFKKQNEKTELIYSAIESAIAEEKKKCFENLESNERRVLSDISNFESKASSHLLELDSIYGDIEKNLSDIVKTVELEPFKNIISRYDNRIKTIDNSLDSLKNHQVSISKLPSFNEKTLEKLKPIFSSFFNLMKMSTSVVKKNENESTGNSIFSPNTNPTKNSLYISFENKDIFQNALHLSTEPNPRRCSDLNPPIVNDLKSESNTSLLNITLPTYSVTSKSNETNKIVKKPETEYESLMDKDANKTPNNKRFSSFTNLNLTMNSRSETHSDIRILESVENEERDSVVIHNFSEKDIDLLGSGNETPKPDNLTQHKANISLQKSTKKYINILDKINANQSQKSLIYDNMIKTNPLISPRYIKPDGNSSEAQSLIMSKSARLNDSKSEYNPLVNMSQNNSIEKKNTSHFNESKNDSNIKEVKNFENFVFFIENKINDEKQYPQQSNFQKNLFCSPNFKENL